MPTVSGSAPKSDRQASASNWTVEQQPLPLSRALTVQVPLEIVMRCKDLLGAMNLCVEVSGLDDKEVYMSLGIEAAQWSRIRSGGAHFSPSKLPALMDICANEVPLIWLARKRGYALVQIETETQRLLRESRSREEKLAEKLAYAESLLRGRT